MAEGARLAVIGVGSFGEQHVKAYQRNGITLVGVADADLDRARVIAQRYGIPYAGDDGFSLIDDLKPDGVSVVTAASAHIPLAAYAVERGCRVLLEKPIAASSAELATLPPEASDLILPAHVLRFEPGHRQLRDAVTAGAVGRVLGISASRSRPGWHRRAYADVPISLLTSIHDIDLAMWVTGSMAVSVSATSVSSVHGHAADLVFAQIGAADGTNWSIRSSWLYPDECASDLFEVFGTEGVASVQEDNTGIALSWPSPAHRIAAVPAIAGGGLTEEIAHFIALVSDPALVPAVTLREAAHAVRIAGAIAESAANGGRAVYLDNERMP